MRSRSCSQSPSAIPVWSPSPWNECRLRRNRRGGPSDSRRRKASSTTSRSVFFSSIARALALLRRSSAILMVVFIWLTIPHDADAVNAIQESGNWVPGPANGPPAPSLGRNTAFPVERSAALLRMPFRIANQATGTRDCCACTLKLEDREAEEILRGLQILRGSAFGAGSTRELRYNAALRGFPSAP